MLAASLLGTALGAVTVLLVLLWTPAGSLFTAWVNQRQAAAQLRSATESIPPNPWAQAELALEALPAAT
jgi:hypothetical protein